MRGKHLICAIIACLCLSTAVAGVPAAQVKKVSPGQGGYTIMPIAGGESSGSASLDNQSAGGDRGPLLDPTVSAGASAVPEPTTVAMMFLGSGCLAALTALRRRRRG